MTTLTPTVAQADNCDQRSKRQSLHSEDTRRRTTSAAVSGAGRPESPDVVVYRPARGWSRRKGKKLSEDACGLSIALAIDINKPESIKRKGDNFLTQLMREP